MESRWISNNWFNRLENYEIWVFFKSDFNKEKKVDLYYRILEKFKNWRY